DCRARDRPRRRHRGYDCHDYLNEKRDALEKCAGKIAEITKPPSGSNVIPLEVAAWTRPPPCEGASLSVAAGAAMQGLQRQHELMGNTPGLSGTKHSCGRLSYGVGLLIKKTGDDGIRDNTSQSRGSGGRILDQHRSATSRSL